MLSFDYTPRKHRARIACRWRIPSEVLQDFRVYHREPHRTTFKHVSTHRSLQNRLLLYFVDGQLHRNETIQGFDFGKVVIGFELFEMSETKFDAELKFSVGAFKKEVVTTFKNDNKQIELVQLCEIGDLYDPANGYLNENGEMEIIVEGFLYNVKQIPRGVMEDEKDVQMWFDYIGKTFEIHIPNNILLVDNVVIPRIFDDPSKLKTVDGEINSIEFPGRYSMSLLECIVKYHYHYSLVIQEELSVLLKIHEFIVKYGKRRNLAALEVIICSRLNESTVAQILNYSLKLPPPPSPGTAVPHDIQNLYKKAMTCLRSAVRNRKPVVHFNKIPEATVYDMTLFMITKDFHGNLNKNGMALMN